MEDDIFSTTNVSLLEEESTRQLTSSPVPLTKNKHNSSSTRSSSNKNSSNSSEHWNVVDTPVNSDTNKEKTTKKNNFSVPLIHQENTVDILKKDNFDLRLKIYFLETRLQELSPAHLESMLKENVKLKETVHKLSEELKKYKKMILDLNATLEIVNKPCPKQHGMTDEERDELTSTLTELEKYHEENDTLSKRVADISAENVRLRSTIRSSKSEGDEERKSKQIQELKQQIQSLHSKINASKHYKEDYTLVDKMKRLEEELTVQRLETDALINELEEKKSQLKEMKSGQSTQVHDLKKQLETKTYQFQQLQIEANRCKETTERLKEENEVLITEIESREQEVTALEKEIYKLLLHFEENNQEKPIDDDERILSMKSDIQERNDRISMLTRELNTMNKSHDDDLEALDEHITKIQQELEEKNKANKDLISHLNEALERIGKMQKEYEGNQKDQFNDLEVTIRERDVRIARLEEDYEARVDILQREKEIMKEETDELKLRFHVVVQQIKDKEGQVLELKEIVAKQRMDDMELKEAVTKQKKDEIELMLIKEQVKSTLNIEDQWKEKVRYLEDELKEQLTAYRSLKHKWVITNNKNDMLNNLLDKSRKAEEGDQKFSKSEQMLKRLNHELRKDLDDKSREYEQLKLKLTKLENAFKGQIDMNKELTRQLQRRENMLTHSLSTFDTMKEHKEFMENILYEQATGSYSLRERNESVVLKH